jgi:hypothetical protein
VESKITVSFPSAFNIDSNFIRYNLQFYFYILRTKIFCFLILCLFKPLYFRNYSLYLLVYQEKFCIFLTHCISLVPYNYYNKTFTFYNLNRLVFRVRKKFILSALRTESLNRKYINCFFQGCDNPCEFYRFETSNEKILLNGFVNTWKEKILEYLAALS